MGRGAYDDRYGRSGRPHRPVMPGAGALEEQPGGTDPAARIDAAHTTAAALVHHARSTSDPQETARLIALADEHGLDEIAGLWSDRPADTLPGALWRLYALRAGIQRDAEQVALAFDAGRHRAPVDEAVAGVATPPGPAEVRTLADAILAGAFSGDLAVALERAGSFCRVVATGWAVQADSMIDHEQADRLTRQAADLARTGTELLAAGDLWRSGALN